MSEQTEETKVEEIEEVEIEDNEPVYYKPRILNLVATITGILSWVVLLGFIAVIVGQYLNLTELSQGAPISNLLAEGEAKVWIYTNLVLPLLSGLSFFFILQGVSIGLNVLLEIDFNLREVKE